MMFLKDRPAILPRSMIRKELLDLYTEKDNKWPEELSEGLLTAGEDSGCPQAMVLLPEKPGDDFTARFGSPEITHNLGSRLTIRKDSPVVEWLKRRYLTRKDWTYTHCYWVRGQ
jgi:hypothetical protein